jgi:thiamine biosynthesis lipoprotein
MATVFEIFILHPDARYARQAAYAAFDELDRIERELSRFVENSDISRINNLAANQSLSVGSATFECLQLCSRMYTATDGAFDITFSSAAKGYQLKLNEGQYIVRQPTRAVKIDLGGIGKGYAIDKMAELLRDWDIDTALIHGGYSSVLALNEPAGTNGWPITLSSPDDYKQTLARLYLRNRAVSGSGLQNGPHIINPRTGRPVKDRFAAWVCGPDAATTDALSTAFMVMTAGKVRQYCLRHPDVLAMIVLDDCGTKAQKEEKIVQFGPWQKSNLLK